jgi:hypothetical protein
VKHIKSSNKKNILLTFPLYWQLKLIKATLAINRIIMICTIAGNWTKGIEISHTSKVILKKYLKIFLLINSHII